MSYLPLRKAVRAASFEVVLNRWWRRWRDEQRIRLTILGFVSPRVDENNVAPALGRHDVTSNHDSRQLLRIGLYNQLNGKLCLNKSYHNLIS